MISATLAIACLLLVVMREREARKRARAERSALSNGIDPHFVFNALNALVELTEEEPARATGFALLLAGVYRYIVANRNRDLVPLADEIRFVESYYAMLRIGTGD